MNKQLVVSHYEQDLNWVYQVSGSVPTVIYDKSGKQSNYEVLNNVGREPHSYIHHILQNYNNLAEWTIFSQDNPFEHVDNWTNIVLGDENDWNSLATQKQPGGYFFSNMGLLVSDQTGAPHHNGLPIAELWKDTFSEECPKYLEFAPSCHCIVHRNKIRARSEEFYRNVKNILETSYISPWAFERYISHVFNPDYR
jgi:hypothetical protein